MLWTLIDSIRGMGVKQLTALLAAVAAVATVLTLAMPVLSPDVLDKRMKSVALERERSVSANANGWRAARRKRSRCASRRNNT